MNEYLLFRYSCVTVHPDPCSVEQPVDWSRIRSIPRRKIISDLCSVLSPNGLLLGFSLSKEDWPMEFFVPIRLSCSRGESSRVCRALRTSSLSFNAVEVAKVSLWQLGAAHADQEPKRDGWTFI